MEDQNKRKTLILTIIAVLTLLILIGGATFAYFQAQVGKGESTTLNVKAGTTDDLSFSLKDLDATKENVSDNDDTIPIVIEPNQNNFASGNNSIADGVSGTAILIAGDDDYITKDGEFTYNVYLNITKNELKYSSYERKELLDPDTDNKNILSFKDEATKGETDLSEYNPRPELYLTIKKNGTEVKTGVTINEKALTYNENVFTDGETQLGGFDITETKGLIKISVPTKIQVKDGSKDNHTTTDIWEITVTFMNLDTDQYLNTGKSVVGEVLIQSEEIKQESIQDKLLADANKDDKTTLYYHNADALTDPSMANSDKIANDDSYRFSGASDVVKNYVCLDSKTTGECESDEDLYRIIGLFKNDSGQYEMKLIKAQGATTTQLGDNETATGGSYVGLYKVNYSDYQSYYKGTNWETIAEYCWNNNSSSNSTNMWQESNLNKINLNQFFYDYITTRAKYLKNHITEHTWITGGTSNTGDAKAVYDSELGEGKVKEGDNACRSETYTSSATECTEEDIEYKDEIGLMYVSDYMYGARPTYWSTSASSYISASSYNWLYSGMYEWLISRNSSDGYFAWNVTNTGDMNSSYVGEGGLGVHPSFYLTSDAKIKEGEGSKEVPYRITFE